MSKHVCDHTRCAETGAEFRAYRARVEEEIERLMEPHKPYPDSWPLRPGNSHDEVRFYCEACRTPWPCRTFNDLRGLYGKASDYRAATEPYAPLVLHKIPTTKEPTDD